MTECSPELNYSLPYVIGVIVVTIGWFMLIFHIIFDDKDE